MATSKTRKPAAKAPAKSTKSTAKSTAKSKPKSAPKAKATAKPNTKAPAGKGETLSLAQVMTILEQSGKEQARKTYTRHGATGPMFGVAFGDLFKLQKRIRVDHDLARELWATGNVDARNLAMKIADPARIEPAELDRWAVENPLRMCRLFIGSLAQESGQGAAKVKAWLAAKDDKLRANGWTLVGVLANRDETSSDDVYAAHLATIEKGIHGEQNEVKAAMHGALIAIGGRSAALRKAATAAAKRIGTVAVDHGPTACETPDAGPYIDKLWTRCGKFPTPAAAERARESMRTRC